MPASDRPAMRSVLHLLKEWAQQQHSKAESVGEPVATLRRPQPAETAREAAASLLPAQPASTSAAERTDAPPHPPGTLVLQRLGWLPRRRARPLAMRDRELLMETLLPLYGGSAPGLEEVLAAYQEGWRGDASTAVCGTPPRCGACRLSEHCRYFQRSPAITDLPLSQRPRERLMSLGEEHLTNAELLGIIIQSGTERETAIDLAQRLLSRFGDFRALATKSIAELCKVRGIGPAKATQVIAALAIAKRYHSPTIEQGKLLNDPDTIFEHYHERLRTLPQEQFLALLLNSKLRFIRAEVIATGELNAAHVNPREAFAPALRHGAAAVVFLHNHPSGDPTPSRDDLALTDRLLDSARILGIQVLDHLIIGANRYTSLARQGYIPPPRRAASSDGGAPTELST